MTSKTPAESILAELERLAGIEGVGIYRFKNAGKMNTCLCWDSPYPSTAYKKYVPANSNLLAACKVMAEALEESLHNWESGEHCDACANNDVIYESLKKALSDCAKLLSGSEGE